MVTRDHGGNLDAARAEYGGSGWIDLSTGINRRPYPVPALPADAWTALPTATAQGALIDAAAEAFGAAPETVLPLAGAQAAIQLYPRCAAPGDARVLTPTYNEHAAALSAQGWTVTPVEGLRGLAGADLAVVVNPNNPDGRSWSPEALVALSRKVGLLVVDESFADPHPELSVADQAGERLVVLRSFGKFYGLAGVRLGFLLGAPAMVARLRELAGPWSVSGPALSIGTTALGDTAWQSATTERLADDAARLDWMAARAGWVLVGGTALFRTYATPDATRAQDHLARRAIWTRRFPYSGTWLRLGLPDGAEWGRVEKALSEWRPV
ncbi:threonine-phosphate decarboxylase CobD [Pararhodobacter zhoushanensis]|uniref:threonine-phosphate decarboxylase n=1 Tax=Pararhodobacter zhoushanensis TaxID=2479545 RepID=A0ABT3GTY9_9RHOB|nr:threonine-phosphate decarboxylase CobD [Pararhodobacter zhoushanensis]MCW1930982.1 threonine-phosphate decarboxylase CobD [Pararhodobacter zhoushanensis]